MSRWKLICLRLTSMRRLSTRIATCRAETEEEDTEVTADMESEGGVVTDAAAAAAAAAVVLAAGVMVV